MRRRSSASTLPSLSFLTRQIKLHDRVPRQIPKLCRAVLRPYRVCGKGKRRDGDHDDDMERALHDRVDVEGDTARTPALDEVFPNQQGTFGNRRGMRLRGAAAACVIVRCGKKKPRRREVQGECERRGVSERSMRRIPVPWHSVDVFGRRSSPKSKREHLAIGVVTRP
jgi:hypothetical protein